MVHFDDAHYLRLAAEARAMTEARLAELEAVLAKGFWNDPMTHGRISTLVRIMTRNGGEYTVEEAIKVMAAIALIEEQTK